MFNSHASFKGVGGREITFDPGFQPWLHVRSYGEVESVPMHLGTFPIPVIDTQGTPQYHEFASQKYKLLSDIEPEIQIGDRIYFHYNTIQTRGILKEEGQHPNRTWWFQVRYDTVICSVRNGVIIPIGSWVLVEPDYETWDDILIETYSHLRDKDGRPLLKPKDQWIQKKVEPSYHYLKGFVRHVGTPLKGDKREVNPGDKIVYRKNADWKVQIEGKEYFAIRQRHIEGILTTTE